MERDSPCALLATSPTLSLTPPTLSPQDKFYFTVRLSQLFKPMLLFYAYVCDIPFLRSQTSSMLSEPPMNLKNMLLQYPKAAFLPLREPITEVFYNQLSDYPVCLIVLTRNPFLPKTLKRFLNLYHIIYHKPIQNLSKNLRWSILRK